MSYATVTYNGTGAQTAFAIPFGLLAANELNARVDDVLVDPADYTVSEDFLTVTFDVAPPAGSENVILFRVTDVDDADRPVDFSAGSTVTAEQLDTMVLHLLHALQEAKDSGEGSLTIPPGEFDWDAEGNRIRNVGAPVDDADAVRKQDLDDAVLGVGQLPAVSGADNDSGLFVSGGVWAKRTAPQIRAHLALGTAAQATLGVGANQVPQMDGSGRYPAADGSQITNLNQAAPAVLMLKFTQTSLTNSNSGTWLTEASGTSFRVAFSAGGSIEFGDTGNKMSQSDVNNTFTLEPGTYLIQVYFVWFNNSAADPLLVDWALTNGNGTTTYMNGTALPSLGESATSDTTYMSSNGAHIITLGAQTVFAFRHRNSLTVGSGEIHGAVFGGGAVGSYALITRLA